jgi:ABC-type branched-subunit amino acid transport system ATPase component
VGVSGSNGAGKSMLFGVITGFEEQIAALGAFLASLR